MDEEINLKCTCGCGMIQISKIEFEDSEEYYLSYWIPAFYGKQKMGFLSTIKRRLVEMWNIAIGKEFLLYEIVVPEKDMMEFSKTLSKILDNTKNGGVL